MEVNDAHSDGPPMRNRFDSMAYLTSFSELIEPGRTVLDAGCGDGLPVDEYLVRNGFAVNGIDVSPRMIELARKHVPEGFYEVKDMLDLRDGEYCVNGVVSLRATLQIPRKCYGSLLKKFASFLPDGGPLLVSMRADEPERQGDDLHAGRPSGNHDGAMDNAVLLEGAGFTIASDDMRGFGNRKYEVILARS